jgi:hypothetical protein
MAQTIVSLENLQSLRLASKQPDAHDLAPLANIKNLKHLSIDYNGYGNYDQSHIIRSILLNSTSTLQSLVMARTQYSTWFLEDWAKLVSANDVVKKQNYGFPVLKSFSLSGCSFDATIIDSLQMAIDFMGLRELILGYLLDGDVNFFDHLTNLAKCSHDLPICINLRSLSLHMGGNSYIETSEQTQTNLEAKCRFLSSFGTLTFLELSDYNQYSERITLNPGLSNPLLKAILKHKNLKNLKISYAGISSGYTIPYVSAESITRIVENLHQLQHLDFAPDDTELVGILVF